MPHGTNKMVAFFSNPRRSRTLDQSRFCQTRLIQSDEKERADLSSRGRCGRYSCADAYNISVSELLHVDNCTIKSLVWEHFVHTINWQSLVITVFYFRFYFGIVYCFVLLCMFYIFSCCLVISCCYGVSINGWMVYRLAF